MTYELVTTEVRPGGAPEFERRLSEALAAGPGIGTLAGCWRTEIGNLLELVELWALPAGASADQTAQARTGLVRVDGELVRRRSSELLQPAPFMRPLDGSPQRLGPIYELRVYQLRPGLVPRMIELWADRLAEREQHSPLAGAWYSAEDRWFHLWPYPDLVERARIRVDATRTGTWPPPTQPLLQGMDNRVLLPLALSPLQ